MKATCCSYIQTATKSCSNPWLAAISAVGRQACWLDGTVCMQHTVRWKNWDTNRHSSLMWCVSTMHIQTIVCIKVMTRRARKHWGDLGQGGPRLGGARPGGPGARIGRFRGGWRVLTFLNFFVVRPLVHGGSRVRISIGVRWRLVKNC